MRDVSHHIDGVIDQPLDQLLNPVHQCIWIAVPNRSACIKATNMAIVTTRSVYLTHQWNQRSGTASSQLASKPEGACSSNH